MSQHKIKTGNELAPLELHDIEKTNIRTIYSWKNCLKDKLLLEKKRRTQNHSCRGEGNKGLEQDITNSSKSSGLKSYSANMRTDLRSMKTCVLKGLIRY